MASTYAAQAVGAPLVAEWVWALRCGLPPRPNARREGRQCIRVQPSSPRLYAAGNTEDGHVRTKLHRPVP